MTDETPQNLSFPRTIDSSMRAEFVACPQSFKRRYIDGLSKKGRSIHLHFGAVFADGIAEWRRGVWGRGEDQDTALESAIKLMTHKWGDFPNPDFGNKTFDRVIGALEAYISQYPPGTDHVTPHIEDNSEPGVEFSFAHPLPILHPETGEPILYSGRFDMLARMGNQLFVEDDKTTSMLGASWGNNWRLRAQFTGYVWGARQFGYDVQGAIVRGISILKSSYGHAEVIEQRPQWMIDRWQSQLHRDIRRMIQCWKDSKGYGNENEAWDYNLSDSCSSFGGCQFLDLCTTENPARWIDAEYEVHHYDPLNPESL